MLNKSQRTESFDSISERLGYSRKQNILLVRGMLRNDSHVGGKGPKILKVGTLGAEKSSFIISDYGVEYLRAYVAGKVIRLNDLGFKVTMEEGESE